MSNLNPYESPPGDGELEAVAKPPLQLLHNIASGILALSLPTLVVSSLIALIHTTSLWDGPLWNRGSDFVPSRYVASLATGSAMVSFINVLGALAIGLRRWRRMASLAMLISVMPCALSCAWPLCLYAIILLSRRSVWDSFED